MSAEYDRIEAIALSNAFVKGAFKLIDAENIVDKELESMKKTVIVQIFITGYSAALEI